MAKDPNLAPNSLIRRGVKSNLRLSASKMRIGRLAQEAADRAQSAHRGFMEASRGGDIESLQAYGQEASRCLQDWARICQIPLPPRPKDGNRPIIDMGMLQELPDDTSLVESLRSKPAQPAPAQPSPTPEPASPPVVDVEQAINPG